MDLVDQKSSFVYQYTSGDGDNVGGNKIIIQCQQLLPESLRKPIDLVLSDIRERKQNNAKLRLETIKATNGLDSESEAVIDVLSYHLNLLEENEAQDVYSSLLSTYKKSQNSIVLDLCLANLIRLDVKKNLTDDARERYFQANNRSSYSEEAYYECIATSEELVQVYETKKLNLEDSLLIGIIRGAFRTDSFEFALTVANRLSDIAPSLNSKVLLLLATAANINTRLNNKHFWTITATLKNEIVRMIDKVIALIEESKGSDPRLFNIAAPCLDYTRGEYQGLRDICWKYIDEIEKNHPEIAARLYVIYNNDLSKIKDEIEYQYKNAQRDETYRTELLSDLFTKKELSSVDFAIFSRFLDSNKVNQWVNSGGAVVGRDDLETDLYKIELLLALPEQSPPGQISKITQISDQCQKVIESYKETLAQLDPAALYELTEKLRRHKELCHFVGALIKPLLPDSDLWPSPIVESYLNALLYSQQAASLEAVSSNINQSEWTNSVWQIQAHHFAQQHDYSNAIKAIEESLKLNANSIEDWRFLSSLHRRLEISDQELALVMQRIPDNVFSLPSDNGVYLLTEITRTGNFARAEKLIVSWFLKDPITSVASIANFCLGLGFLSCKLEFVDSDAIDDCIGGIRFNKNEKEYFLLLVDKPNTNQQFLLDSNSPFGKLLTNMEISETKLYGIDEITLIERKTPFNTVCQISLKLNEEQNVGSNYFTSFTVPVGDPEATISAVKRIFSRFDSKNISPEEQLNNPDIPIMWKGKFASNKPTEAALKLLCSEKRTHFFLPDFGVDTPSTIILDIYAITYLAITGLVHGIKKSSNSFVITQETKSVIENWLEDINRKDYMSLGLNSEGCLFRVTADDIRQATQEIQNGMKQILAETTVVKPSLADVPLFMLTLEKVLDISVYSSACLAITK